MLLLVAFAFLAGALTALSPCALPVLPAVLSAGATGGRRRPLGVVIGLTLTFSAVIVGLAQLVEAAGLGTGTTRALAVLALGGFGVALMVPGLRARAQRPFARLARFAPRSAGTGFWSGLGVGGALGFAYAPCAGPVLAAVVSVGAATGRTVTVGVAYALGSAVVLGAIALLGRRLLGRPGLRRRAGTIQVALGGVMALTAVGMALGLDLRVQTALAGRLPAALVDPSQALEELGAVRARLRRELVGAPRFPPSPVAGPQLRDLPRLGRAPDFAGTGRWFNTPGGRPRRLADFRGRVVLVDFWTYTCINCIRTFSHLRAWDGRYRAAGLDVVGVHTPEFPFERDPANVAAAVRRNGLRYPVAQDNERATWRAWGNLYWPAQYLVDAQGQVRFAHAGEGDEEAIEAAIRALLVEAGATGLGPPAPAARSARAARGITPELYLGAARAERLHPSPPRRGVHRYAAPRALPADRAAFGGVWRVDPERATAVREATLDATVRARAVYVVLAGPRARRTRVEVLLDGRPLDGMRAGADVRAGAVAVTGQRLYRLLELPGVETHRLTLRVAPGVSAYAFSFG